MQLSYYSAYNFCHYPRFNEEENAYPYQSALQVVILMESKHFQVRWVLAETFSAILCSLNLASHRRLLWNTIKCFLR